MPAELYWKDATLDKLNAAFAADLCDLYNKGLTAASFNLKGILGPGGYGLGGNTAEP